MHNLLHFFIHSFIHSQGGTCFVSFQKKKAEFWWDTENPHPQFFSSSRFLNTGLSSWLHKKFVVFIQNWNIINYKLNKNQYSRPFYEAQTSNNRFSLHNLDRWYEGPDE